MKGRLIVFEGLDGAGSTTQSKKLLRYLKCRGVAVEWIDCPGASEKNPISKLIHEYLSKKHNFSPQTLFLLYSAIHLQNIEKIKSWMTQGKLVIVDRYFPSALAYQGAQGLNIKSAISFVKNFAGDIKADAILYLKVTPETGLKRKKKQRKEIDRHEEDLKFLQKVSDAYDRLASDNVLGPWFLVDGERPIEQVFSEIKNVADKVL